MEKPFVHVHLSYSSWNCIESYSAIWGHIAHCSYRITHVYTCFTSKRVSCMYRRDTYKFYNVTYGMSGLAVNRRGGHGCLLGTLWYFNPEPQVKFWRGLGSLSEDNNKAHCVSFFLLIHVPWYFLQDGPPKPRRMGGWGDEGGVAGRGKKKRDHIEEWAISCSKST